MKHPKISITLSAIVTAVLAAITILFLSFNTLGGYIVGAGFLFISLYSAHRLYTKFWLYNWGKPLSEEKELKREQMRRQRSDYQRYNIYHRWYRFADATEEEYQAEKAKETLKKLKRK